MKIPFKKPKLFVYQKMIIVFTALLIPVYLINLWTNINGATFIKEQLTSSHMANVDFYSNQLDDHMSFIRNQQLQFLNDSNVQKMSFQAEYINTYEEVMLVSRILEHLTTIHQSSDYILNAGVYIQAYDKTISTKNGVNSLPNTEWDLIDKVINTKEKEPLYDIDDRLYFIEYTNNDQAVAYIELSKIKLENTLHQVIQSEKSDAGIILTDHQFTNYISVNGDPNMINEIAQSIQTKTTEQSFDTFTLPVDRKKYFIVSSKVSALGWTIYSYTNQEEFTEQLRKFTFWFFVLSITSLIIILVFSLSVNRMIHRPLNRLMQTFKKMETNQLRQQINVNGTNEFDYLYRNFNKMTKHLDESIQQNYEQKIALQDSEFKQLQSQINPHFLYNSFYNIYRLCKMEDSESASILAQKLGSYYKFITKNSSDEVVFEKEYQHAMDYCDIQSIRFSNRISIKATDIPDECKNVLVPRIIIQPLIENVFEHAFTDRSHGEIYISVKGCEHELSIIVEDDGEGLTDIKLNELQRKLTLVEVAIEHTALINVAKRIRLKFGEGSGLAVSQSIHGGLKVEITILIETGE